MMKPTISSFSAMPWQNGLSWVQNRRERRNRDLFELCKEDFEAFSVLLGPEGIVEGQGEGKDGHGGRGWRARGARPVSVFGGLNQIKKCSTANGCIHKIV